MSGDEREKLVDYKLAVLQKAQDETAATVKEIQRDNAEAFKEFRESLAAIREELASQRERSKQTAGTIGAVVAILVSVGTNLLNRVIRG